MNQSLSMMFVLEGGYPRAYLSVQDNYQSPAQVFNAPLEFIDFNALVDSTRNSGEYQIVSTSPDNPDFQIESYVIVQHHDGEISWDIVFEHYEPFLSLELSPEADDLDENVVSFTFDAFQYTSTLYQACLSSSHLLPVSFSEDSEKQTSENDSQDDEEESPIQHLAQYTQRLNILWQKHGNKNEMVKNGQAQKHSDHFAHEAEKQWLQDIIDTLDDVHNDNVMENLDAYLESLPEDALSRLEKNRDQLQETLTQRWEMLINSLTKEEADALENDQINTLYPNSLKLRLINEFIDGNPAVLLGSSHNQQSSSEKVIDLQSWKHNAKKPD
uniref:Uncharacterized protein n=1 Tax=uncultured Thiotrichaceae bacterium TaxID=298394 RepID=A0A6S6UIY5_9GAMM|nr:MAG: Unknown protein [uncultured Thiotrichaceae bacterium]